MDWDHTVTQAHRNAEALWTFACYQVTPILPGCVFTNVEYEEEYDTIKEVWKDGSLLTRNCPV